MRWRLLHSPPLSGADNMALDVALMTRARRTGETVLRVYGWSAPTLSFGRNQRVAGHFSAASTREVDVVRRPTGGRALLHHREVTYSVTAPASSSLADSYRAINGLLVRALAGLGIRADVAPPAARPARPTEASCFAEPAAGELTVAGRKLAGSAQWRDAGALLQHGSILLDDDQPLIGRLRLLPGDAVPPPATLRALLGRPPAEGEVASHLWSAVRDTVAPDADHIEAEPWVMAEASRVAAHFRDDAWTWRR